MPKQIFTSDLHLGDQRLDILGRPFIDEVQCGFEILNNLQLMIAKDDVLYVIGDLSLSLEWLERFDKATHLAKKRILIKGNYDKLEDQAYHHVFSDIIESYIDIDIKDQYNTLPCRLHHYPSKDTIDNRFSLCGHIHGAWKVQKNMLNVGVDAHHFRPLTDKNILFYFNAICNFYDEDVWVGTHKSNLQNSRGKVGTYWKT